jgi:hypothetical protein
MKKMISRLRRRQMMVEISKLIASISCPKTLAGKEKSGTTQLAYD